MLDPQLKRGLLDICILAALRRGDSYGYQLIRDLVLSGSRKVLCRNIPCLPHCFFSHTCIPSVKCFIISIHMIYSE